MCGEMLIGVKIWMNLSLCRRLGGSQTPFCFCCIQTRKVSLGICEIYKTDCLQTVDYEWQRLVRGEDTQSALQCIYNTFFKMTTRPVVLEGTHDINKACRFGWHSWCAVVVMHKERDRHTGDAFAEYLLKSSVQTKSKSAVRMHGQYSGKGSGEQQTAETSKLKVNGLSELRWTVNCNKQGDLQSQTRNVSTESKPEEPNKQRVA